MQYTAQRLGEPHLALAWLDQQTETDVCIPPTAQKTAGSQSWMHRLTFPSLSLGLKVLETLARDAQGDGIGLENSNRYAISVSCLNR